VRLNDITLGQAISDFNNRMITLSKVPNAMNKATFKKWDLLKVPKLITLSD
jgi:hypothetical protein